MTANSQIFSSSVFGNSSGLTSDQLSENNRKTQEKYLGSSTASSMSTRVPRVPSNQRIARDKK
jgi:hypothetical protein